MDETRTEGATVWAPGPQKPDRKFGLAVVIAAAVVATVLAACSEGSGERGPSESPAASPAASPTVSPTPAGHNVAVNLSIGVWSDLDTQPKKPWTTGVECTSYDFRGEEVRILDGSSEILAVGTFLTKGVWTPDPGMEEHLANGETEWRWDGTCTWTAVIEGVGDAPVYVVEIEGFEGSEAHNASDLEADGWTIDLEA